LRSPDRLSGTCDRLLGVILTSFLCSTILIPHHPSLSKPKFLLLKPRLDLSDIFTIRVGRV
jgi:hypothetical protein